MQAILAPYSISEFKTNPGAKLKRTSGAPLAVLCHNEPAFYAVPKEMTEVMTEQLNEKEFTRLVQRRRISAKAGNYVEVEIDLL